MTKILANDGIDATGKKMLEDAGFTVDTNKIAQEQLAEKLKNYDAVTVRSATKIRKEIIDANPQLRLIGRGGVGMDNIDVEYAKSKNIAVVNTPAASSNSVAELVMAHCFSMVRYLGYSNRKMSEDAVANFNELKKYCGNGQELYGKTLGIIGIGRIGRETARIAIGCGMNVIAYDPFVYETEIIVDFHTSLNISPVKFSLKTIAKNELLKQADFITLHVPAPADGGFVIGADEISIMKNGSGIINCSRGGVVDETALLSAVKNNHIAFAALDVFATEPPIENPEIFNNKNICLSPHIGGSTQEAQNRIGIELAEKIIEYFKK